MRRTAVFALLTILAISAVCCKKCGTLTADAVVEVTVVDGKGGLITGRTVKMYDEKGYEAFGRNPGTEAALETPLDARGKAVFTLKSSEWFKSAKSRELMFAVVDLKGPDNYRYWSHGGTVEAGKSYKFTIVADFVEDIGKLLIENGVVQGLADSDVRAVEFPAGVTEIAARAFMDSGVEEVILNEGLLKIGDFAFRGCALKKIVFPSTLKETGTNVFEDCRNLESADLSMSQVSVLQPRMFRDSNIKSLSLPQTLKEISSQAFLGTSFLESVELPEGVSKIGNEAFRGSGLTKLSLPNNISGIGERAFHECKSLTSVRCHGKWGGSDGTAGISAFGDCPVLSEIDLPESIVRLEGWTFIECKSLERITAGSRLEFAGDYAFQSNYAVKEIVFRGRTAPALGKNVFPASEGLAIRVPEGCREPYLEKWANCRAYHPNIVQ